MSVIFFKAGTLRTIQLHSRLNSDTYYFSFEYEGRYKRHPFYSNYQGEVGHADDQIYLFSLSGEFNEEEQVLSDMMVDYYANFMYTGNPNTFPPGEAPSSLPFWPKFDTNSEKYLIIDENTREASKYEDTWAVANRKRKLWHVLPYPLSSVQLLLHQPLLMILENHLLTLCTVAFYIYYHF